MVVVGTIVKLIVGLGVLCVNADLTAAEGAVLTLPKLNSPIKTVVVEINGRVRYLILPKIAAYLSY